MMKSTLTRLVFLITAILCGCADYDQTNNQNNIQDADSIINCYDLIGDLPNLTIVKKEYYGKVFLGVAYDSNKLSFERYSIVRSTLWKKSDKSVFSSYNSDTKMPLPEIYIEIIKEIKSRVDNSNLKLKRNRNIEKCSDINWLILPVEVK